MNNIMLYEGVRASGKTHYLAKLAKKLHEAGEVVIVVAPIITIGKNLCEIAGIPLNCIRTTPESLYGIANANILVEQWWDLKGGVRETLMRISESQNSRIIATGDIHMLRIEVKDIKALKGDWGLNDD